MTDYFAMFAESDQGDAAGFMEQVMDLLKKKDSRVILLDRHMVAGAFRDALRSNKYGDYLKKQIKGKKIVAAMMDGFCHDEKIRHFTFSQFQQWFNQYDLWSHSVWTQKTAQEFRENSKITLTELDFLDTHVDKVMTESRYRDRDFVQNLLDDLDNPVLVKGFGKHHASFVEIAKAVYDDDLPEGIIRVVPYARDDDRNISLRFDRYLREAGVNADEAKGMIDLVCDFGNATLAGVVVGIISDSVHSNVVPRFAPDQVRMQGIMQNSVNRHLSIPVRQELKKKLSGPDYTS